MKPFLIEKRFISYDQELVDTFNNFFEHGLDNLGLQEYPNDHNINIISDDPIDYVIAKYKNHLSSVIVNENVSFES